jgi:hypothetical protein
LIRGRRTNTIVAALRAAIARAWLPLSLTAIVTLFLFFVFGLSVGLLSYYYGVTSSVAVLLALLVLERLIDRGWLDADEAADHRWAETDTLVACSMHRILRVLVPLMAVLALVWIWLDAIELPEALEARTLHSAMAAFATLLVAYVAWVLCQLAIDHNLQGAGAGPKLPGTDDDSESAPGSRLQTMLPLLRAAFGILVAVVAALVVLSRFGIDTAPLIAGAGVFQSPGSGPLQPFPAGRGMPVPAMVAAVRRALWVTIWVVRGEPIQGARGKGVVRAERRNRLAVVEASGGPARGVGPAWRQLPG